jgi:hypothetical protein
LHVDADVAEPLWVCYALSVSFAYIMHSLFPPGGGAAAADHHHHQERIYGIVPPTGKGRLFSMLSIGQTRIHPRCHCRIDDAVNNRNTYIVSLAKVFVVDDDDDDDDDEIWEYPIASLKGHKTSCTTAKIK